MELNVEDVTIEHLLCVSHVIKCQRRHKMGFKFNETFPHNQHIEKGNAVFKFISISVWKCDLQTQKGH